MLASGCCILPKILPPDFVQACLSKAQQDLNLIETQLDQNRSEAQTSHDVAAAWRVDYREIVDRDGGRRDVRLDWDKYPYNAPGLIYNAMTLPLIQALFHYEEAKGSHSSNSSSNKTSDCQDIILLYMGVMWAKRQKPKDDDHQEKHQKWHADGGHLFGHVQLPPHCINVFIPLIDLTSDHGPTEVQVGSHHLNGDHTVEQTNLELIAKAGDAILFDYRLQHRGKGCSSVLKTDRPILYLAYAKSWFRDTANTRSGRSIFEGTRPTWASRILTGEPLPMGQGFDRVELSNNQNQPPDSTPASSGTINEIPMPPRVPVDGSGERWVLFKMNVQIGENDDAENPPREETMVVYNGDMPVEVATQFCYQHQLGPDFIPVLGETIQQQMNQIQQQQQATRSLDRDEEPEQSQKDVSETQEPQSKRPRTTE